MSKILDGNMLAKKIKSEIAEEISRDGLSVGLAVIIVGDDPASRIYVNHKKKDCEECGIVSHEYALPADTSQDEIVALIRRLNEDSEVNGILIQQPFPKHINVTEVNETVSPLKDVDAFRADTFGKVGLGVAVNPTKSELRVKALCLRPCTPWGVMELIHSTGESVSGKECVVVGRSNIVGKPMALMLLNESATVTVCHSRTRDLGEVTRRADVLVSAVGIAGLITSDMVKDGATVIDVGMNRDSEGKLCGDVLCDSALMDKVGFITPVPGGVGPMTRAMLMKNTLTAKKMQS
ncbi:MAG: bifunctional 5,10-methylenetetrahydrofolate dehydrogenase/5,10-methenyltetrahydrofolate cyclohydrolase [Oscillospiraceae bacterium]|nr:bifunctional 5,10-methylenetetrahydrofolate dehydrogenase/5,10-methenyltetrahydrofolate cyclohydrolase [Oscillospiraceae bacterium]